MAKKTLTAVGYHANNDLMSLPALGFGAFKKKSSKHVYTFENFFHPFVGELIEKLNRESLPGMLDPSFHAGLKTDFFTDFYTPQSSLRVGVEAFPKEIDVATGGPYANYNWELLFHIPLTIAVHLSKNQRFAEAQRWFHFIFDPTANDPSVAEAQRCWKFIAFRQGGGGQQIDEMLAVLSKPAGECSSEELELKAKILEGYQAILDKPFRPHAVARTRPLAYMYSVVMKYLDNLIAWGDHLFLQDTLESVNEATLLYVLAANVLGPRPEKIPLQGKVRPKTFAQLKAQGLDPLGNALVELEGSFPFNLGVPSGGGESEAAVPLFGIGRTLYFCVPRNDNLLAYWDEVADRLFKIRHCMNIAGVVRSLALFDPPLDPGMLVKAAAAGIDIGAIVAGLNQPVSPVRAQVLIQKALELAVEVRSLGNALLAAIEKGDGERLALLRQGHEIQIQQLQKEVRFLQWKQAQEATESLLRTRATALERYRYYLRLLGQSPDGSLAPETLPLDRRELTEENFDEAYAALVGQYEKEVPIQNFPRLRLQGGGSPAIEAGAEGSGSLALIQSESDEITHLGTARDLGLAASIVDAVSSALVFIPDINTDLHYWGLGGTMKINIGTAIIKVLEVTARGLKMAGDYNREQAGIDARTAAHARRADDWTLQGNLAAREMRQIGRQILASLIGEQVARREYQNLQRQIEHSREVERFLEEKFTNAELYAWMQGELSRLYYEYYRFAFDTARRAEKTMKRELMRPELDDKTLIQFNYWDGGRKGLLSGEALHLDVKRMDLAYHEHNLREYEMTKNVSLLQVDPLALVLLRATGRCTVTLPETVFDFDGPGLYFRRIKTVALSIPCVTGSYGGVHCKLTQLKSSVRKSPLVADGYAREGLEDSRFQDYFAGAQSIVASSGQQDSGLFETNLRDDRYLPFENTGAISEWQIELPADPSHDDPRHFDYDTISDVVLHIRYTAREGGGPMRTEALKDIKTRIENAEDAGTVRLFSLRHEFPTEWARFQGHTPDPGERFELAFELRDEHYPYWSQGRLDAVERVDVLARSAEPIPATLEIFDTADQGDVTAGKETLTKNPALGDLLSGRLTGDTGGIEPPSAPTAEIHLFFDQRGLDDLWIAVTWSGSGA